MEKNNKQKVNEPTDRDKFDISDGNRKVLETIPLMMTTPKWRIKLRKLVLDFIQEQILQHHAERGFA